MRFKKFRIGEKILNFPSQTWNDIVDEVEKLRNSLDHIEDTRKPKEKSPVIVRLVWSGGSLLEPGHAVKLSSSVFDPTTDVSAPFSGLTFHCGPFGAAESLEKYAITIGPIEGGGAGVGYGFIPEATWAKVLISDTGHTFAKIISGGTVLESSDTDGLLIIWKPSGTGEKWCVIPLAGSNTSTSTPPLRAFELTANKALSSATATAKWLDLDGNLVGDAVTLHDPEHRFSGRIADNLYGGSLGFRGYALLRHDLAEEDPEQYDIIEMDALMEFIKGDVVKVSTYPTPGSTLVARYQEEINSAGYDRMPPAAANSEVGFHDDSEIYDTDSIAEPDNEADAEEVEHVLLQLTDPDASPPEYRVYEVKRSSGSSGGVTFVGKTTGTIPARVDVDTPGTQTSSVVDVKEGTIVGDLHNWSQLDIEANFFVSGFECDGNMVIVDVWC